MKKIVTVTLGAAIVYSQLACGAFAAAETANLGVSMTVTAECSLTTTSLDFGSQGQIAANVDAAAQLDIQCTAGTPYTISMDAGGGAGADTTTRVMTSGADTATYGIYKDNGRSSIFGSTGGDELTGTATGVTQTIPIYGRVPPQNAAVGTYSDSVTVTLTY